MKQKTKSLLALLLTASLVLLTFTSVPASAEENDTAYKAAYLKLIQELRKGNDVSEEGFDRFKLIYLDNDRIPELLAVDTPSDEYDNNNTYVYVIYTFYNGKAVELGEYQSGVASAGGYRGNTYYIKKSGKIFESYHDSASGDGKDTVYSLQDGKMNAIAEGEFNIASDDTTWNGKAMNSTKYNKKLNKVFKLKKAISFEEIKTISYSSMKKKLK